MNPPRPHSHQTCWDLAANVFVWDSNTFSRLLWKLLLRFQMATSKHILPNSRLHNLIKWRATIAQIYEKKGHLSVAQRKWSNQGDQSVRHVPPDSRSLQEFCLAHWEASLAWVTVTHRQQREKLPLVLARWPPHAYLKQYLPECKTLRSVQTNRGQHTTTESTRCCWLDSLMHLYLVHFYNPAWVQPYCTLLVCTNGANWGSSFSICALKRDARTHSNTVCSRAVLATKTSRSTWES